MQDSIILFTDGSHKPITASPNVPLTATCPEYGTDVHLRKRQRMDGETTWFYHRTTTATHLAPAVATIASASSWPPIAPLPCLPTFFPKETSTDD